MSTAMTVRPEAITVTQRALLARVERGAAFLDERKVHAGRKPWRECIDIEKLDLSSHGCCVLGQVYGDYFIGVGQLDLSLSHAARCGFNVFDSEALSVFVDLTAAWREYLQRTPS